MLSSTVILIRHVNQQAHRHLERITKAMISRSLETPAPRRLPRLHWLGRTTRSTINQG
jgi:hypothetical protein